MASSYKQLIPRPVLQGLAFVFIVCTVTGSFLPGPVKSQLGTAPPNQTHIQIAVAHRVSHVTCFGLDALVLLFLGYGIQEEIAAVLLVAILGYAIEATQYLLRYSAVFEWWDLSDDLWAIAGAALLVHGANVLFRIRTRTAR